MRNSSWVGVYKLPERAAFFLFDVFWAVVIICDRFPVQKMASFRIIVGHVKESTR